MREESTAQSGTESGGTRPPTPPPPAFRTSVRSLWDWLPTSLRRFYKVRLLTAVILTLPAVGMTGWYAFQAFAAHEQYSLTDEGPRELDRELFHLHLYDILRSDLRRLTLPPPPEKPKVPVYDLLIDRGHFSSMVDTYLREKRRPYFPARIRKDDRIRDVEVRFRGTKHWHWNHPQKSLKVRLVSEGLLEDARVFNFLNEVTPMGVGEQIIMELTHDLGVLSPARHPARVSINGRSMGLFTFLAQPDEALLRKAQRFPGAIFSGNEAELDPKTGLSRLFTQASQWKKVARARGESKKDFSRLEKLLTMLQTAPAPVFEDYARYELNLDAFAAYEALDVLFGGDQHDFDQNHKLYFDPCKGRFEPIAWNFRAWRHRPRFHLAQHPIQLRLNLLPEYVLRRNRLLYQLLMGPMSVSSLERHLGKVFKKTMRELRSDPFWDAYHLLPRSDDYLRRMVRPMDEQRWALVLASEMKTYGQRHAYLSSELKRACVRGARGLRERGVQALVLQVEGRCALALENVRVSGSDPAWTLYLDRDLDGRLDPDTDGVMARGESGGRVPPVPAARLHPLKTFRARETVTQKWGPVDLEGAPGRYVFFLTGADPQGEVKLEFRNLVTRGLVSLSAWTRLGSEEDIRGEKGGGSGLRPGNRSLHPWSSPAGKEGDTQLGPGVVQVEKTRVFSRGETVVIPPHTRLRMGPGASLIFLGPVHMTGTSASPVIFEPADPRKDWGGIALQGPGTAGSRLTAVQIRGGTRPSWRGVTYGAVLNLHDTRDLELRGLRMKDPGAETDQFRAAYVKDLLVENAVFTSSAMDAMDIEFSKGIVRSCRVTGAGEDGLDVMGSRLLVQDCVFLGCGDNGVSVGQRSRVELRDCFVARSGVGALVKSASRLRVNGSLLFDNRSGLRRETREVLYSGTARLEGDVLYAVDNDRDLHPAKAAKGSGVRVMTHLPTRGRLRHLRKYVLHLNSWESLDEWVGQHLHPPPERKE